MRISLRTRGYTLVEVMMTVAVTAITGSVIIYILNTGMVLFAKNSAINIAHQQARTAVIQIEQDLHSAVSLPQLCDAAQTPVTGAGPAAGMTFWVYGAGPYRVNAKALATDTVVKVAVPAGGSVPKIGQRLILPDFPIELEITNVSGSAGGTVTVTVASALGSIVDGAAYNVVCFTTDRVTYVVNNGNLIFNGPTTRKNNSVMAQDITSALPFSIPNTAAGSLYYRFVAAVDLSTADPEYSNRAFKSSNMFLNSMVPMRARLCTLQ